MSTLLRVAWYRFRTTFGRRWPGYTTIILLVGLVGGLAMGSIAGARRTQSSFPVYAASTNPSQIQAFDAFSILTSATTPVTTPPVPAPSPTSLT